MTNIDEWCGEHHLFGAYLASLGAGEPVTPPLQPLADDEVIDPSGWSIRVQKILKRMEIRTWGQLASLTEDQLRERRNCGDLTVREIERRLGERGLYLRGDG